MKILKFILLLLIVVIFYQCKSSKFVKNPPFQIDTATYNHWVGGIPGVSGSIVELQLKDGSKTTFDSIFFQKKRSKVEVKENDGDIFLTAHFDTSKNQKPDLVIDSDVKKELKNPVPEIKKFPFDLKENEAVISYKNKGRIKYFKIKSLKNKKNPLYK